MVLIQTRRRDDVVSLCSVFHWAEAMWHTKRSQFQECDGMQEQLHDEEIYIIWPSSTQYPPLSPAARLNVLLREESFANLDEAVRDRV